MIEVSVNNASKNFGFKNILDGFDLEATTGERIALIGPNGCGKTTLFKIISGEEILDKGMVSTRKGATIGLLSQIPPKVNDDVTVRDILLRSFADLFELEKKMREYEAKLATIEPDKLDSVLKVYGKLQEHFDNMGGYAIDEKVSKICNGFKITYEMLIRSFNTLSGGEKVRLKLFELIQKKANLLLLDEPTNHIDIDTKEMLEEFK